MVRRNLTGAHYGLATWILQRITAIIMLISTIGFFAFVAYLAVSIDGSISSWQAAFSNILVKIVIQVFFGALLLHAWVGIRDLWMDYVKNAGLRLALHTFTVLWLIGGLIYSLRIIWG